MITIGTQTGKLSVNRVSRFDGLYVATEERVVVGVKLQREGIIARHLFEEQPNATEAC